MRLLAAALCLAPALAAADSAFTPDQAARLQAGLSATADAFIHPAYAAQAAAAARMETALSAYCDGAGALAAARAGFAETFLAWRRASIVPMGPVEAGDGPFRVQLWPDPKGFSRRALRAALKAEDPALLAEGGLKDRSIALVNLTALEHLLFSDLAPDSYGCRLARAIAAYQADLAAGFAAAWAPGAAFRARYDGAAVGNAAFATVDDAIRDLLSGMLVFTDRLRRFRIGRGLGDAPGEARPERTEAAASGLGLPGIAAGLRALSDLYQSPDGFFEATTEVGGLMDYAMLGGVAGRIADTLAQDETSLTAIAEADGEAAQALRGYGGLLQYHEDYLGTGLAQAIGLTTGFTSADGD